MITQFSTDDFFFTTDENKQCAHIASFLLEWNSDFSKFLNLDKVSK